MASESVDGLDVPWEEARRANLAKGDDRVPLHVEAYHTAALRHDPDHLSAVVRADL